jgi:hypothetical protein
VFIAMSLSYAFIVSSELRIGHGSDLAIVVGRS